MYLIKIQEEIDLSGEFLLFYNFISRMQEEGGYIIITQIQTLQCPHFTDFSVIFKFSIEMPFKQI